MVRSLLSAISTAVSYVFFTGKCCVWIAKSATAKGSKGSSRSRIVPCAIVA
jgi:26S proteasome regulatory subunit T2